MDPTGGGGFFALLFQQFVALLSVFCIAPSNAPNVVAANIGPPGPETVQVAEFRSDDASSLAVTREPLAVRVIQTQIDGLLGNRGIGMALARTADGITGSIFGTPFALRRALDNGGVEALQPVWPSTASAG